MKPRIVRVDASPLKLLAMREQAHRALDVGDVARGRSLVGDALGRLELAKASQDVVLDADARTPEQPAGDGET